MKKVQDEIASLAYLRAFACLAVIILHTFYAASDWAATENDYSISITVRNMMMWAVPCFVMVSGTLLLDKNRNVTYVKLFRKYILRMIIALIIFSELFAVFDCVTNKEFSVSVLITGLQQAVTGSGWKHMWYLYLMIAIYLLLPLYRKIAAHLEKKDAYYLLSVYFVFLTAIPMIQTLTNKSTAFYICVYSVYPLYLFLGYIISQKLLVIPRWGWGILAFVSSVLIAVLSLGSVWYNWERVADLLESYAFPLIALQSAGIYGLINGAKPRMPKWLNFVLKQIDYCSFGMYLLHMLFLKLTIVVWKWNPYAHGGVIMVIALTIAIAVVSFICVRLLKYVPGLKKLL